MYVSCGAVLASSSSFCAPNQMKLKLLCRGHRRHEHLEMVVYLHVFFFVIGICRLTMLVPQESTAFAGHIQVKQLTQDA
jgi:hypothetical protein